jgi:predicted dienelactone hydrolase
MTGSPVVSVAPLTLSAPERGVDLEVRVSAPVAGTNLPVVAFSHGFGSSSRAYGPLVDVWAARGLVVVQPTHLDSRTVGLAPDDPRAALPWRTRAEDLRRVLDDLEVLTAAVPGLAGRVDPTRVGVAGHSFGGQTAGLLLGLRVLGPDGVPGSDLTDPRVRVGVLLATAGRGGDALAPGMIERMPWLNPTFEGLRTPTLVVAGDADHSPLTVRGPAWMTDPYRLAPGATDLLTVLGGEHSLGGIAGYEAAETTDEDPTRVDVVARATGAYLHSGLVPEDDAWARARADLDPSAVRLESHDDALGRV